MRIEHTVVFRLRHAPESPQTAAFLSDARELLTSIPAVQRFVIRRQVSPQSEFTHQFAMFFDDDAAYRTYNEHPNHVAFVADRWVQEVVAFQELDFVEDV